MIKISVDTPITTLSRFSKQTHIDWIYSSRYFDNEKYKEFYTIKQAKLRQYHTRADRETFFVDDSLNSPFTTEAIRQAIIDTKSKYFVINKMIKDIVIIRQIINNLRDLDINFVIFPQGNTFQEWIKFYDEIQSLISENDLIGINKVDFFVNTNSISFLYNNRVRLINYLVKEKGCKNRFHIDELFNPIELRFLNQFEQVYSLNTNIPTIYGLMEIEVNDDGETKKPDNYDEIEKSYDYTKRTTLEQLSCITGNVNILKSFCK